MRIGMIGYGTVGQGVADLLVRHREVYRARCGVELDLVSVLVRDVARAREVDVPVGCEVTDDPGHFFGGEWEMMVEVAGGAAAMLGFAEGALRRGAHLVTANKSLISAHGAGLLELARERGVKLRFEAAVAGGIPVISALECGMLGNTFERIEGVLNGTCNFILTTMEETGRSYEDVLEEAKGLGYAEADPTMDVSGRDAAEKISILRSLAFDGWMTADEVAMSGIEGVGVDDVRGAMGRGERLRLVARADADGARVGVESLWEDDPLARLPGSENAVTIVGDAVGTVTLRGAGAGRYPTASAVVSDVVGVAGGW